jgi:hypothetical protein
MAKIRNRHMVNIPGATNQTLTPDNFTTSDQIKIICTSYDSQNHGTPKQNTTTTN